eukprot:11440183-Alexandrium_andersonii.AAC.1
MSASLVGSEMCIRDSLGTAEAGGSGRGIGEAYELRDGAQQQHGVRYKRCLLYTSDAADDM